jgi:(p)ppGpp synthase/HD superfamily hydrolase
VTAQERPAHERPAQRWVRVVDATQLAFELHAGQVRKGATRAPYVGHLLGVAAIVIDEGGDEDQVVAALLHDAPEDQGGRRALTEVRRRYGPRVAAIVDACTDTYDSPKPAWRERKEAWLDRLTTAPTDALLVIAADKLHNARATVVDLRSGGVATLDMFNGGRAGTLWYYRAVSDRLGERAPGRLTDELARTVGEMERLARELDQ